MKAVDNIEQKPRLNGKIEWLKRGDQTGFMQGYAINELIKKYPVYGRIGLAFFGNGDNERQVYILRARYKNGRLLFIYQDNGNDLEAVYRKFFEKQNN